VHERQSHRHIPRTNQPATRSQKRTHTAMTRSLGSSVPSLKAFMQRFHVLSQFRKFLRVAQALDEPQRSEVVGMVKREFRKHAMVADPGQVRTLLVTGGRQLEQLEQLAGWTTTKTVASLPHDPSRSGDPVPQQEWPWDRGEARVPSSVSPVPRTLEQGARR
jgi:hypothetical protein